MTQYPLIALMLVALVSAVMSYLGAAVGLVLGQFRVVLLTYVLGGALEGTATSLAVSTVATIVGAVAHARAGRVKLMLLITVGGPSSITAYAAARYARMADPRMLKIAIAVVLLCTSIQLLWRANRPHSEAREASFAPSSRALVMLCQVTVGATLGVITGLVGLLLGSVRLPAIVRLADVSPSSAVGTNMAIGAITGLSAGVSALAGGHVNLLAFAILSPLTLLGAHLGARKTGQLDPRSLVRWIAYVLIPTALFMLAEVTLELTQHTTS